MRCNNRNYCPWYVLPLVLPLAYAATTATTTTSPCHRELHEQNLIYSLPDQLTEFNKARNTETERIQEGGGGGGGGGGRGRGG